MSRTRAGYLFKCKVCGKAHLMYEGKPRCGIRLPCVDDEYAVREYDEEDFHFWHGFESDVFFITVNEVKY